ncbi:hypothetical protein PIB30_038091, partial [Stylosanthes scabra]|nr:hypothetical protein [Stylosanthes scabra]
SRVEPFWMDVVDDEAEPHPAGSAGVLVDSAASAGVESNEVVAAVENNGAVISAGTEAEPMTNNSDQPNRRNEVNSAGTKGHIVISGTETV